MFLHFILYLLLTVLSFSLILTPSPHPSIFLPLPAIHLFRLLSFQNFICGLFFIFVVANVYLDNKFSQISCFYFLGSFIFWLDYYLNLKVLGQSIRKAINNNLIKFTFLTKKNSWSKWLSAIAHQFNNVSISISAIFLSPTS